MTRLHQQQRIPESAFNSRADADSALTGFRHIAALAALRKRAERTHALPPVPVEQPSLSGEGKGEAKIFAALTDERHDLQPADRREFRLALTLLKHLLLQIEAATAD